MKIISTLIIIGALGTVSVWLLGNQSKQIDVITTQDVETSTEDSNTDVQLDAASAVTVSDTPIEEDLLSLDGEIKALPATTLSEAEIAGLQYTREEEKLARDVYLTLYDVWGMNIFNNIAQSEQTHTDSVKMLLDKYDIADPVVDDTIGVFRNQELQKLYDNLTNQGGVSLVEALNVGALIEDLDIYDLQTEIAKTDNEDIILVYENLMRGSRNHMRSFVSQLETNGGSYTPQHITQAEFDSIIADTQERGGGGRGHGRSN